MKHFKFAMLGSLGLLASLSTAQADGATIKSTFGSIDQ